MSSYLPKILGPLEGKTKHHVKKSKHYTRLTRSIAGGGGLFCSNDVSLFINIPIPNSLEVIRQRLVRDNTLKEAYQVRGTLCDGTP